MLRRGALWDAASTIATARFARVGLITGFYVPQGSPPAAETDGPVGVALLAKGFEAIGIWCRVATDAPCRGVCAAALAEAGIPDVPIDVVAIGSRIDPLIETWRAAEVTHAISIERCGRSADGAPRNMRGEDIGSYTAPLDDLFSAGPWETIAVGDGGNEIGMGALSRSLIGRHVAHGETIACVTPAQHLIVAGVSNWGAYALLGALAALREDWRASLLACLDERARPRVLEAVDHARTGGRRRVASANADGRQPRHRHASPHITNDPHVGRARA